MQSCNVVPTADPGSTTTTAAATTASSNISSNPISAKVKAISSSKIYIIDQTFYYIPINIFHDY